MTEVIQETLSEMRETVESPMLGVTTEEGRAVEKFVKDMISDWAKTLEDEITAADKRHLEAYNSKCDANDCLMAKLNEQRSINKELTYELESKDAEITELRNMIEKLADALHPFREWYGNQKLIDRAKEMIGLKEKGDMT